MGVWGQVPGHVSHLKALYVGQCCRMCSEVWVLVSQGHSYMCFRTYLLHSVEFTLARKSAYLNFGVK